ncbi:MAG: glycosyltransferase [Candidatus Levybacteria bacterium]|nr:glycosyltransferase [Candidatus Levybacteria bacterium]
MQQPLVSVLVHTKNSKRTIKKHLESIVSQSYKPIEIIMVDNNSTDNTVAIAKHFTRNIFTYGPERSAQRNFAAKKAKGDYFLVPDSDMILGKNVVAQCVSLMLSDPKIKAIVIPEESIGEGFWTQCKILERSFYFGVDWIEAARFFKRKTFERIGGYDEKNTGTEDYDLPQQIIKKYGKESTGRIKEFIYHDEGRLSLFGTLKKKFYYAQKLQVYKDRNPEYYGKQANIIRRYVLFFSNPIKLFRNPVIGLGMLFMKTCEFAAGGLGYLFKRKINVYAS